jgi:hypothetical protein
MDTRAALPRLLIAASGPGMAVMRHVWEGHAELRCALYMEEALRELEGGIDLVLCSLHFDESSMFELLHHVRTVHPGVPFVGCCVRETRLRRAGMEATRLAALAGGAAGYVDLAALRRRHGCARGDHLFRHAVLQHRRVSGVPYLP